MIHNRIITECVAATPLGDSNRLRVGDSNCQRVVQYPITVTATSLRFSSETAGAGGTMANRTRNADGLVRSGGDESQALLRFLAKAKKECKPQIYTACITLMNAYHGNM